MTTRRRLALLAACVVAAVLVAWYAAGPTPAPAPRSAAGSAFLGPDPGEDVAAYLARAATTLPWPGTTALALVQFAAERTGADALAVGGRPVEAVFRVGLPRVQTALRFEPLEPSVPAAAALENARRRAAASAAADAARLAGRPRDVAAAEAAALGQPACACVLALVVVADGATLRSAGDGVRVVEAAPPGTTVTELALSPLLPEQTVRADPLPDDGPVPT